VLGIWTEMGFYVVLGVVFPCLAMYWFGGFIVDRLYG
jgi:hypothetical protein